MMPGPPPVITGTPDFASSAAVCSAAWYIGSSGVVRAEPKIETPPATPWRFSNPQTNSPRMRNTRHESEERLACSASSVSGVLRRFSSWVDFLAGRGGWG